MIALQRRQGQTTVSPRYGSSDRRRGVIALGGGGARGLAHLGVMEAIGDAGVVTERIVGVSMGSLMGGLCAVDQDIHRVQATATRLLCSPVFSQKCRRMMGMASKVMAASQDVAAQSSPFDWFGRWYDRLERIMSHGHRLTKIVRTPSILSSSILQEAIEEVIPDIDLSETQIPLSIVAADLKSGHRIVLENGSLRKAILASTAIPGFFPPVDWDGMLLCDIGVLDALPLGIAKSYASDLTIGVDVGSETQRHESMRTAIDVVMRMEEIGERLCRRHALQYADLVIRPAVGHCPWYDFRNPESLIDAGRDAGRRAMQQFRSEATRDYFLPTAHNNPLVTRSR